MNEIQKEEIQAEEGGVSVRDIIKRIGKKIWFVLGGSFVVALAAVLVFMFAINPVKKNSSMSFEINYPMSENGKYPDGSTFNYRDIVSRSVVKGAIDSDESFASLDLDKIMKNEGISVSAARQSDGANFVYTYTVTLKQSYFQGVKTDAFIKGLTESFTSFFEAKANGLNYEIDEDTFKNASFKDQLTILDEEKAILIAQYDLWIKEYNEGHMVLGKSLGSYRTEVITTFADNVRSPISTQLSTRGYEYFNCKTTGLNVKDRIADLQEEMSLNGAIIAGLKEALNNGTSGAQEASAMAYAAADAETNDSGSNIIIMPNESDLSSKLAFYSERQAILNQQIENLQVSGKTHETMTDGDYDIVAEKIRTYGAETLVRQCEEINRRSETLKSVIASIYRGNTVVTFNSQRATENGGTSLALVGVAVFVISFILFAVVAYFTGKKEKKVESGTTADGANGEGAPEKNETDDQSKEN